MPFFNCHCEPLPLHGACPEQNEILPLPLHFIQSQGQNDRRRRVQGQGDKRGVIASRTYGKPHEIASPAFSQGQACFGPRNDNSLCNSGLFWLSLRDPSRALTLRVTEWVSLRPFLLSLRAEHMTISGKPKLKNQRVK